MSNNTQTSNKWATIAERAQNETGNDSVASTSSPLKSSVGGLFGYATKSHYAQDHQVAVEQTPQRFQPAPDLEKSHEILADMVAVFSEIKQVSMKQVAPQLLAGNTAKAAYLNDVDVGCQAALTTTAPLDSPDLVSRTALTN